jgi:hypothetical protein
MTRHWRSTGELKDWHNCSNRRTAATTTSRTAERSGNDTTAWTGCVVESMLNSIHSTYLHELVAGKAPAAVDHLHCALLLHSGCRVPPFIVLLPNAMLYSASRHTNADTYAAATSCSCSCPSGYACNCSAQHRNTQLDTHSSGKDLQFLLQLCTDLHRTMACL